MSAWEATGTIGAERIIDGLVLSLILLAGLGFRDDGGIRSRRDLGELPISVGLVPTAAYSALLIFACCVYRHGAVLLATRRSPDASPSERSGSISPQGWHPGWRRGSSGWRKASVSCATAGCRGAVYRSHPRVLAPQRRRLVVAPSSRAGFPTATYSQVMRRDGRAWRWASWSRTRPGFFGAFQFAVYAGLAMFFPPAAVMDVGAAFVFVLVLRPDRRDGCRCRASALYCRRRRGASPALAR